MSSRSTNKPSCSRSSSAQSKHEARVVAQTPIDAKLHVDFEESDRGGLFDYSTSVDISTSTNNNIPSSIVSTYLRKIQKGSLIQPFGCMIAIHEQNFKILAYSENAPQMLDLDSNQEEDQVLTFGIDVRSLFLQQGAASLHKAASFGELNFLNPILLHSKASSKPFYAILHRIDVGLVLDLEPVNPEEVPAIKTSAGALKSYKLAAKAISRLQSLPSGNISLLCDVVVQEVRELTGYDRVMVYRFHEDEHGEVIAESCKPDMDSYLGLHYPATDIPQASRFLFMKNKVRMICDCHSPQIKVVHDETLEQPVNLCGSTLRSPHGCHAQYMANMGSIASLVMSVTISGEDEDEENDDGQSGSDRRRRRLWGLVVCHHTSPRFVPFPLRYACEFLIQVFGVQMNKEVDMAAQLKEKQILNTQTVLCDMLLRNAPLGIITESPNVMDLVRCDGAALYYKNKFRTLGVTPTEKQMKDIIYWLLESHSESTGLSTDCLMEAGYADASVLGDDVCGMAAIKITAKDFLFWFRSHTAKEVKWGGAKHDPLDKDDDDGRKMHPRSSFKAFLEVVKRRSLPWEDVEMDAIHSLQLILRGSLQDETTDDGKAIVTLPPIDASMQSMHELRVVTKEMVRLIETAFVPILAVDPLGNVSGWNTKVAELTGLITEDAIGKPLVDLVLDHSVDTVKTVISSALQGTEMKDIEIRLKTFSNEENKGPVFLVANACCSRDLNGKIIGIWFVSQDLTGQKTTMEKYMQVKGDYVGIMWNPSILIPPIFMIDENGRCLEWNYAMQKMSGKKREEVVDKMLLGEVFTVDSSGCRLKDQDTFTKLQITMNGVIAGHQTSNKLLFGFFNEQGNYVEALLSANKRIDVDGKTTGILCFLHVASPELQYSLQVQRMYEEDLRNTRKKLAYIRSETVNPLNGIKCMQKLMESSSNLSEHQRQLLKANELCQEQMTKIFQDTDVETIEESYLEIGCGEFNLGEVMLAVINQAMGLSQERQVQVLYEPPAQVSSLNLYGDHLRLQQVLSDFLTNAIAFSPAFEGSSVQLRLKMKKEQIGTKMHIMHLEFRIRHPTPGIPDKLINEMFKSSRGMSREGLGLYISQKLVKAMNGSVQYVREDERLSFLVLLEFPLVHP
ncbi:phytochrome C [Impatiens glandulifera]|uniref:phytochrome C n=1 Tax=Impatiens glandulifera TaxID=253017 RepID=UPI001FB1484A|nr:phytochrome C [Impatiens glandulifera]XP_047333746.1 phytochrome C [Impatiens glandulifera]